MAPADYLAVRDSCYAKKRKASGGKLSDQAIKDCKTLASIWFWKKHGKTPQQAEAVLETEGLPDELDLQILEEQIEFFGSLEVYQEWSNSEGLTNE